MKEPGQVAYEAYTSNNNLKFNYDTDCQRKALWVAVEAAVLAAYKPERPAGVWVTLYGNLTFLSLPQVRQLHREELSIPIHWVLCYDIEAFTSISEADARKIVEAMGGTWPEEESCKIS